MHCEHLPLLFYLLCAFGSAFGSLKPHAAIRNLCDCCGIRDEDVFPDATAFTGMVRSRPSCPAAEDVLPGMDML